VTKSQRCCAGVIPITLIFGASPLRDCLGWSGPAEIYRTPDQPRSRRDHERSEGQISRRQKPYETNTLRSARTSNAYNNRTDIEWPFWKIILKIITESGEA